VSWPGNSRHSRNSSSTGSAGKLTAHELNAQVHQFHQGPAREVFKRYQTPHHALLVASSLVDGLMTEVEVRWVPSSLPR
jgi:hypothetical protein